LLDGEAGSPVFAFASTGFDIDFPGGACGGR
jgi:hypothetical protein